jgi:DNA-binding NarL/FixJ family response regulator
METSLARRVSSPSREDRRLILAAEWRARLQSYHESVAMFRDAMARARARASRPPTRLPPGARDDAKHDRRPHKPRSRPGANTGRLTARQVEVAVLIARGLTNQAIADELVLTPGTVANHVEHILTKLGFRSRAQVAVWAVERGLVAGGRPPQDVPA